jgi:GDP-L-fucose synthase
VLEPMSRIYIAAGDHVIGEALLDVLAARGHTAVAGGDRTPDPTNKEALSKFFASFRPEYVIVAGGESGGIGFNQRHPARLMRDNIGIALAVMQAAYEKGVDKLLYLGSSCGYPKDCPQPMKEEYLFTGAVEPTSAAYAYGKLAGIQLARAYRQEFGANFITAIPANEFGPGDSFEPNDAHVVAALIRRMHDAKEAGDSSVEIWGSGEPVRDFIFSEDLAEALLLILDHYDDPEPINIGSGEGHTIRELAETIRDVVGFEGELAFDASKPDGMPRKVLDASKVRALGWQPRTPLRDAIARMYAWYREKLINSAAAE